MKYKLFCLIAISIFSNTCWALNEPQINYQCMFSIALGGFPSRCFNLNNELVEYRTIYLATRKRKGRVEYLVSQSWNIPSKLESSDPFCGKGIRGQSKSHSKVYLRNAPSAYVLLEKVGGKSYLRISKRRQHGQVKASLAVYNSERFMGGGGSNTLNYIPGTCKGL